MPWCYTEIGQSQYATVNETHELVYVDLPVSTRQPLVRAV